MINNIYIYYVKNLWSYVIISKNNNMINNNIYEIIIINNVNI